MNVTTEPKRKQKVRDIQALRASNAAVPFVNKSKYTRKIKHKNKETE